jgi:hypothetical protein
MEESEILLKHTYVRHLKMGWGNLNFESQIKTLQK